MKLLIMVLLVSSSAQAASSGWRLTRAGLYLDSTLLMKDALCRKEYGGTYNTGSLFEYKHYVNPTYNYDVHTATPIEGNNPSVMYPVFCLKK